MRKFLIFLFFLTSLTELRSQGQCPPGRNEIRFEIRPDDFFWELTWQVTNPLTGDTLFTGESPDSQLRTYVYCVDSSQCIEFKTIDPNLDGFNPGGYYRLYFNGVLVLENEGLAIKSGDHIRLGCPPGLFCESAITIDTGAWVTPTGNQTWYRFVPADTGVYHITTCFPENACPSKIWVYNGCEGLVLSDNIAGATAYSEDGCVNGALLEMRMVGGKEYFIRLRSNPAECDSVPIHFAINFFEFIRGCNDSTACNYDPLATILEPCLPFGDPNCWTSDLVVDQFVLQSTMTLTTVVDNNPCLVKDGCLRGLGPRNALTFATKFTNIGISDYYVGTTPPTHDTPSDRFTWDICHGHWHLNGYAEYLLYDANGYRIPIGTKPGFCIVDYVCPPNSRKYDCTFMGITAGCSDIYDKNTLCQWIDITDIPPGDYTVVVRVNWKRLPDVLGREEANYDNNSGQACFTLTYPNGIPLVEFHNEICPLVVDCAGVVQGDAQPDCNGVCNGPALHGDLNQDTMQTVSDVRSYLQHANADDGDASGCYDLDANGTIDVYDAALLQECVLHHNDTIYWSQRFPCLFPAGFNNIGESVTLQLGALDTVNKTLLIQIANPYSAVMGFEFSLSGLEIDSIVNVHPDFMPDLRFNNVNGEIVGLGLTESVVPKNAFPVDLLRVHYSEAGSTQVCLDKVTAVVNSKYQLVQPLIGTPNCATIKTSGVTGPVAAPFMVFVQPNPFRENTNIYFENEALEPVDLLVADLAGRQVMYVGNLRSSSMSIEKGHLPPGAYMLTIRSSKGAVSCKLIAQ